MGRATLPPKALGRIVLSLPASGASWLVAASFKSLPMSPYDLVPCVSPLFSNIFIYLFLAALGLCCCMWAFSSCGEWGLLFIAVRGLLIAVASLAAEHGL